MTPIFTRPSSSQPPLSSSAEPASWTVVDQFLWAVADCPENYIARRLVCAAPPVAAPAQAANDDLATGLPLPKPWLLRTAKNSPLIKSVHVETPLDLAAVLGFYRLALGKRGWTETDGAAVAPDRAFIAFTTSDGPAALRLTHQDDRTVADLWLRKADAATGDVLPSPGHVKLSFGNDTDEAAVITLNNQTINLPAGAKLPDSQKLDLPPGKFKASIKLASGAAQTREFDLAADETWALLIGPHGVPFPVHLY